MAGRESVSYDYLAPPRADDAAADAVSSEDAEGETQRCALQGFIFRFRFRFRPPACHASASCACVEVGCLRMWLCGRNPFVMHVESHEVFRRPPSLASSSMRTAAWHCLSRKQSTTCPGMLLSSMQSDSL